MAIIVPLFMVMLPQEFVGDADPEEAYISPVPIPAPYDFDVAVIVPVPLKTRFEWT